MRRKRHEKDLFNKKLDKFSIRKFTTGTFSVAIGSLLLLGIPQAQAAELDTPNPESAITAQVPIPVAEPVAPVIESAPVAEPTPEVTPEVAPVVAPAVEVQESTVVETTPISEVVSEPTVTEASPVAESVVKQPEVEAAPVLSIEALKQTDLRVKGIANPGYRVEIVFSDGTKLTVFADATGAFSVEVSEKLRNETTVTVNTYKADGSLVATKTVSVEVVPVPVAETSVAEEAPTPAEEKPADRNTVAPVVEPVAVAPVVTTTVEPVVTAPVISEPVVVAPVTADLTTVEQVAPVEQQPTTKLTSDATTALATEADAKTLVDAGLVEALATNADPQTVLPADAGATTDKALATSTAIAPRMALFAALQTTEVYNKDTASPIVSGLNTTISKQYVGTVIEVTDPDSTFTVDAGTLPPGFIFDAATNTIKTDGTATSNTYTITVNATDALNNATTQTFTIQVVGNENTVFTVEQTQIPLGGPQALSGVIPTGFTSVFAILPTGELVEGTVNADGTYLINIPEQLGMVMSL